MTRQKCQPRLDKKNTWPNHNGQAQNDYKVCLMTIQNGYFLTKNYSKKIGSFSSVCYE
jgi:hypothetical protein